MRFLAFDNVEFDSGTFFFAHTIMNKHNALHAMLEIIIYSVLKAGWNENVANIILIYSW